MQPEQMRAARGALNWNLDRLAEESGVHRNTLSNFETRKYLGDPIKLDAIQRTFEAAGMIFTEDKGVAGIAMRRFQVGDIVRLRRETRQRDGVDIAADERGVVVGVEEHPPQTGPTYRMWVRFARGQVPGIFRFEYELIHTKFTDEEISLLEQLAQREQTISGNKSRDGLNRLIKFGYVTQGNLNLSDTLYNLTDIGRTVWAMWKGGA